MRQSALTSLFAPGSVAVVGASDDQAKYGNWIAAHALAARDVRPVHLVNRRGERVLGEPTHRRLTDVGEPVELVVVAVPAAGFEAAVDDALEAGARAIVGITAGFAERGEEGAARERAIVARVREAGAVLLGPNCLGVADTGERLLLSSNPFPAGSVAVISQSGNVALELGRALAARGLGVSRFASLGNQADLTAADLVAACAAHARTRAIAVYCEDFLDGRAFAAAAAAAVEAGRPVVLLTVGAGRAASRMARSHTGALTTDGAVVDAACRAAGIHRAASVRELADLLAALDGGRRPRGRRLAIIADGGGHAALAADLAERNGLEVPVLDPALAAELRAELPPSAATSNPIDLAGAGEQDVTVFARTLDRVLASPGVDAVLLTGWFGSYEEYGAALAAAELATAGLMAAHVREHGKPVHLHTPAPAGAATAELRAAGVPAFEAVDDAVRALGLLHRDGDAPRLPALPPPAPPVRQDGYWAARELLGSGGVPFPAAQRVRDGAEAAAAAAELGGPVALKATGLLHKSDQGGVALDLAPAEVAAAHAAMAERLGGEREYVVERMADTGDGVELIAGVRRDPRFGPVAMVGLGGVFAETLRDVAFALAPVEPDDALGLLGGLRSAPLLRGARGRRPLDLAAVADAVATLSRVAAAHPEIAELEINPLLATPRGCIALDARMLLIPDPRS